MGLATQSSARGGGGAQGRISVSQTLCEFFVRNLFGVVKDLHRPPLGCAFAHLLTCPMPKDLVIDDWFPMEVAEVLKWSFPIGGVLVAFNRVQTGVLVDAPVESSRK